MWKSTLSALWLATLAWGANQAEEDNVKSIGLRTHTLVQVGIRIASLALHPEAGG